MMPILVKSDDVRSGRKAKACHGQLGPRMGVNGLNYDLFVFLLKFTLF